MLYLMQPARSHGLMASIGRCKNWPKKAYPCNTLWARAARPRYYYEYHLETDTSRGVHYTVLCLGRYYVLHRGRYYLVLGYMQQHYSC